MHAYRTHHCAELTKKNVGEQVKLSGWVHRKRDHGNLLFIDMRDHYGITQLVITNDDSFLDAATAVKNESVITSRVKWWNVMAKPSIKTFQPVQLKFKWKALK